MSWHRIPLQSVAPTPWRNGGGTTRELVVFPVREHWHWRLSVAEISQDGPFSRFDDVERWFAVLSGSGVRLAIDGAAQTLTRASPPVVFDGAALAECQLLDGPTLDFNLMVREGRGRLERVYGDVAQAVSSGSAVALWSGNAQARATFEGQTLELPPLTLAWRHLDMGGRVEVSAPDGLWAEIAS
ncbi:MAG: HutD family protein [Burkholderiales bacterium]|nr:HutD family protein [Burkholderiales bacterium]